MDLFQAVMIFVGLSLDNFVVMMNKGATLRNMKTHNYVIYSLIFACFSMLAVAIGYVIGNALEGVINDRFEVLVACIIILNIGTYIAYKSWRAQNVEEHVDKNFNNTSCIRLAAMSSLDSLFLAVGISLFGITLSEAVLLSGVICFLCVSVAMAIGYTQGSRFSRAIGMCGGGLMIVFGIYLLYTALL